MTQDLSQEGFYVVKPWLGEGENTKVHDIEGLRTELLDHHGQNTIELSKKLNLEKEDNYFVDGIQNDFNQTEDELYNGGAKQLKEYIELEDVQFSRVHPEQLKKVDLEKDPESKLIPTDEVMERIDKAINNERIAENTLKNEKNNLLGTAIYEPNNKEQQKIIVKDLENNNEQEYPIKHGKTIEHNNREYPLQEILSENNLNELRTAIKENQATSFMLSKTELSNIQGKNLFQSNEKNLANENKENLSNEINTLRKENQHLKKQVHELEGSLKLTYVQAHMLAKDNAPQVKDRMQQVAEKSGFGDTFKEKANEYDAEIQQKEQKSEKQNDKDIDLSL